MLCYVCVCVLYRICIDIFASLIHSKQSRVWVCNGWMCRLNDTQLPLECYEPFDARCICDAVKNISILQILEDLGNKTIGFFVVLMLWCELPQSWVGIIYHIPWNDECARTLALAIAHIAAKQNVQTICTEQPEM